jgi:hypothetical protein
VSQHLLDSADAGNLFATNNTFKAANTDDASERQSRPRSSVGFIATVSGRLHAVPEVVVALDIHYRKDDAKHGRRGAQVNTAISALSPV